ncbi:transcriptional regulator [Fodinicola feengrottensis]|uniref:Transcriptional regulator n=1 Tax=Fodinicola feengrottensis TaxID=435914 RepID=A0ABP4RTP6_9ACTN
MGEFERSVTGIGALAEPVRRELYFFVCGQDTAVSRDQAADAVGVPRHQAKFHLDKLAAEGLLEADYARLDGRTGPGAGHPSKLYRRATNEISVSLPRRQYQLAGLLMADAITDAARTGAPVLDALDQAAATQGAIIGRTAAKRQEGDVLGSAVEALAENGYEPRRENERVVLANCPFHALAAVHTELVCRMNRALVAALAGALAPDRLQVVLEPAADRCCVVLTASPHR